MKKQADEVRRPEQLWTVVETAAFLNVPKSTLYQWHHYGKGPQPYKVCGHLRYDPALVMRWLEGTVA